jgi:mannose-6-phosphate isomerase-like protein (cupin superfamily)
MGGLVVGLPVGSDRTGGTLAIMEQRLDAGRMIPPHRHEHEDEYLVVLGGTLGARVGDEELEAVRGAYVIAPRRLFHAYWNPSEEPVRFLGICAPGGFERYFVEFAQAFSSGDPDVIAARRRELGVRYGLSFEPTWIPQLHERHGVRPLGD